MKYGLIGEKLTHSLSKKIYEMCGLDYSLTEIKKEDLQGLLKSKTLTSFNVTIPYKQTIMPMLDYISDEAKEIGAVNTVMLSGGKWQGYNTDIFGMRLAFNKINLDVKDKNVVILGTGGTSNTAYYMAKTAGAKSVVKVSRTGAINYENVYELTNTNIIINTTPVGMYPNNHNKSLELTKFPNLEGVFDAVYNPLNTELVIEAKSLGLKASGGLYMLVGQAIKSMSIFNNEEVDYQKIDEVYKNLLKEFSNLVLIGMPSCGKSTIGKKVAEKLNKKFVDTDELFTSKYNILPSEEIVVSGESAFRQKETEVIKSLIDGNLVIATGGGVVTKEENIKYLKQNGILVYIKRDLHKLSNAGRPLSQENGVEKLFNERKPLYEKYCDIMVSNNKDLDKAIREVIKGYEKDISN